MILLKKPISITVDRRALFSFFHYFFLLFLCSLQFFMYIEDNCWDELWCLFFFSSSSLLQRVNECLLNACNNINSIKTTCLAFTYCSSSDAPGLWKDNENVTACLSSSSASHYGIFQDIVPLSTETSLTKKISFSMFWGFKVRCFLISF